MHLVLTYFHNVKGPEILISYPDAKLEEDIIEKLIRFFDLEVNETFFEIILINKKKRIINLYFEITSEWARGKKELAMLSLIMKDKYESRLIYSFLVDAVHKIISYDGIFKAFYKNNDFHSSIEIDLAYEVIKKILFDCLNSLIGRLNSTV
ncbi:MAG: hypothetical protein EU532_01475 [Promethearchaeota archaeon]|nr:MAG: hypothetical protein EU532_01475 [Candidatus Lokiarchaeota archaeon]